MADFPLPDFIIREDQDLNREMQLIVERYSAEEKLLAAVASGDEEKTSPPIWNMEG